MPTDCDPCPGKRSASAITSAGARSPTTSPAPNAVIRTMSPVLTPALAHALVERDRDRGGRRVAVADRCSCRPWPGRSSACSPTASMIRRFAWCGMKRSTCSCVKPCSARSSCGHVRHRLDGDLEGLVALHLDERQALLDRLRIVGGPVRAASRHADEVVVVAVGLHDGCRGCRGRRWSPGAPPRPRRRRRGRRWCGRSSPRSATGSRRR